MELELLAPAGNMEKLLTALNFGAKAVYFSGKSFGLRAFAGNFTEQEIAEAVNACHEKGAKAYVTVNIVAHNADFDALPEYAKFLEKTGVDGVIVSDIGVMSIIKENAPKLAIHVSTQANVTNKFAAMDYCKRGAKRIVLARELSLKEIKEIRDYIPSDVELEAFVHGAMCISYSGRCLLSNYLSGRDSNRGACIQACRFGYTISEVSRKGESLPIEEDERGTYILNSKDLNMIEYLDKLSDAGVTSFKIEGRMKSQYYVATVVNAYARALKVLDECQKNNKPYVCPKELVDELEKTSHRRYTTGFNFKETQKESREYLETSQPVQSHEFVAIVLDKTKDGKVLVEQRNRFKVGDTLEVLSPNDTFNKQIKVDKIVDINGEEVLDAKNVQAKLYLFTDLPLASGDILRVKVEE